MVSKDLRGTHMVLRKWLVVLSFATVFSTAWTGSGIAADKCAPVFPRDCAVVLTFDDGPRRPILKGEEKLLEFLAKENIAATFFVQGWQATQSPDLVRELTAKGHVIANHTNGHAAPNEWGTRVYGDVPRSGMSAKEWKAFLFEKGKQAYLEDVLRGEKALFAIIGYYPLFFRPPLWEIDKELYCKISDGFGYVIQVIPRKAFDHECPSFERTVKKAWEIMERDTRIKRKTVDEYSREHEMSSAPLRDLNPADYDLHRWFLRSDPKKLTGATFLPYLKKHASAIGAQFSVSELAGFSNRYDADPAGVTVEALALFVVRMVEGRLKNGVRINVFALHELPVSVRALRLVVPELRKRGYRFENLPFIYGIDGCVGLNPDRSIRCN